MAPPTTPLPMDQFRPTQIPSSSSSFSHPDDIADPGSAALMKAPKRKRLAKACDACHKSKRRCDGTAPCSNCYYASKTCTYTDASGRPVPAPRPFKPERVEPDFRPVQPTYSTPRQTFPPQDQDYTDDDNHQPQPSNSNAQNGIARKRFRNERGNAVPTDNISSTSVPRPLMNGPPSISLDKPAPVELDHPLTRELTNLFFTHCHPARAIIHKPTFAASLAHSRVPAYLLHAVCALAAPLSKQPRLRTIPARFAGRPFAQEALSLMFDGAGRLVCERNLATAQALCLLQVHDVATKDKNMYWDSRYHDLALQIVESLNVYEPDYPTLTPIPSPEFIQASIEREALRRIFWLIHLMDVMAFIFFKKPIVGLREPGLRLRLPADETTFELGVSTLPEYLYLPAVRTQYSSEFGHLIRVITIYAKIEVALDELGDPDTPINPKAALKEAEQQLESWAASLSEHLRFSESILAVQQSMFETSSNTGAWCWCLTHVFHASSVLALNTARQRSQPGPKGEPQWAINVLHSVMQMLGDRAKNSFLMCAILWALVRYCRRDDPQTRAWCAEYENAWGTRIRDIALDFRSSSPPVSQSQLQQPQPQPPHRRMSEARGPPMNGTRPSHQHDSSYTRRSPATPSSPPPLGKPHHRNDAMHQNSSGRTPPRCDWDAGGRGYPGSKSVTLSMVQDENIKENGASMSPSSMNGCDTGQQSLPSLKSCGLLDSWSNGVMQQGQRQSPPQKPLPLPHEIEARGVGLMSMPVGLQWLANESR